MAVEVVKLNSGFDMPVIGLGTWLVRSFVQFVAVTAKGAWPGNDVKLTPPTRCFDGYFIQLRHTMSILECY